MYMKEIHVYIYNLWMGTVQYYWDVMYTVIYNYLWIYKATNLQSYIIKWSFIGIRTTPWTHPISESQVLKHTLSIPSASSWFIHNVQ